MKHYYQTTPLESDEALLEATGRAISHEDRIERWADVPGQKGKFKVSSIGRVKSLSRPSKQRNPDGTYRHFVVPERILKHWVTPNGYWQIRLWHGGKFKLWSISRLVLSAFNGLPTKEKPHCMHLNHNPSDNSVDNLKWGTHQENMQMDWAAGRRKPYAHWTGTTNGGASKSVNQFNLNGSLIKTFPSAAEIERQLGISHKLISLCCRGKMQKTKGFIFKLAI